MRRLFLLAVILFSIAVTGISLGLAAETQREGRESLLYDEIPDVLGVSKKAESYRDVPLSVYVITREELLRWGVRGLYETLERTPGNNFYDNAHFGQNGTIARGLFMIWRYGFSFELMPLMDYGHLALPVAFIKSVEVVRGPAALAWGSSAQAGLTNINIRDDLEGAEMSAEVGNFNRLAYNYLYGGKLSAGNAGDNFFVGLHYVQQDPEVQTNEPGSVNETWNTNGFNPSYAALAKIQFKQLKFLVFFDHTNHPIESSALFGAIGPTFLSDIQRLTGVAPYENMQSLSSRIEYHLSPKSENTEFYFYTNLQQRHYWMMPWLQDIARRYDFGFNGTQNILNGRLSLNFGGDLWSQAYLFDPSMDNPFATPYGLNGYTGVYDKKGFEYKNLFLQGTGILNDRFKVILGGRLDYQQGAVPQDLLVSGPRLGLIYTPGEKLTFKYLYNRAARRPQANELFGAAKAKEDMLTAHELVTLLDLAETTHVGLTLYSQKLSDAITRNPVSYNDMYNAGGMESTGVEWDIKHEALKNLLLYWNGSYQRGTSIEGTVTLVNGNTAVLSLPHDDAGRPFFVPELSSFIGGEIDIRNFLKLNIDLRSHLNIPYLTIDGTQDRASAHFVDCALRTRKLGNTGIDLSFAVLNLLDDHQGLPAFGEYATNASGTLKPEGRKYYARATMNF